MEARRGTGSRLPRRARPPPRPAGWRLHWDRTSRRGPAAPGRHAGPRGDPPRRWPPTAPHRRAAEATGCGVLVGLGGDLGPGRHGTGRRLAGRRGPTTTGDALESPAQTISVALRRNSPPPARWPAPGGTAAGAATTSWDPRHRRENPVPLWRTVSVAAGSCGGREHREHGRDRARAGGHRLAGPSGACRPGWSRRTARWCTPRAGR